MIHSTEPTKAEMRSSKVILISVRWRSMWNNQKRKPPTRAPIIPIPTSVQNPKPRLLSVITRPASVPASAPTINQTTIFPIVIVQILSFRRMWFGNVGRERSPPERPWAPCSVPTVGSRTVHCHCCVIILGNLLLNSELLVTLVSRFGTDVSNACFLVFKNEKNVSIYGGALDFVRRQGGKHLLLFWCLRRAHANPSCTQQGCCIP